MEDSAGRPVCSPRLRGRRKLSLSVDRRGIRTGRRADFPAAVLLALIAVCLCLRGPAVVADEPGLVPQYHDWQAAPADKWPQADSPVRRTAEHPSLTMPDLFRGRSLRGAHGKQFAQAPDRLPPDVRRPGGEFPELVAPEPGLRTAPPGTGLAPDRLRLPLLPDLPPGLATPQPSPEIVRDYGRYIEQEVDPENVMNLLVGRPRILRFTQTPLRIYVPNEDVATIEIISDTEMAIVGVDEGTTVLNVWMRDADRPDQPQILSYLVRVIPDPERRARLEAIYQALEKEINRNFPDSVVHLSLVGDKLLIRGQAKDIEDATQILRVVGANAPGGPERIPVQNLNVNVFPQAEFETDIAPAGLHNLLLAGDADLDAAASTVINMLRIPGEQQVMLRVVVAEVSRSALRSIGANVAIGAGESASFFGFVDPASFTDPRVGVGVTGGKLLVNRGDFQLAINALRSLGLARTLAEPNLVTLNGRPARFLAGGSFPVPLITGFTAAGLQGVEFVPFGVQLMFLPVITDRDRVRLQVAAAVSTRDEAAGATIGNAQVPGLSQRTFMTSVELREGQTLAVAGLIQNNYGADSDRVPFLGDMPFLGTLFRNNTASYGEQELVVLVTPELVHPLDDAAMLPLPGSDVFEPDDIEFFLKGRIESCFAEDYRSSVRTTMPRMKAYRQCEQQFIIGPSGFSDGR
jgi:pilus assembly protein CpaC